MGFSDASHVACGSSAPGGRTPLVVGSPTQISAGGRSRTREVVFPRRLPVGGVHLRCEAARQTEAALLQSSLA